MPSALVLALSQIGDPAFRAPLLKGFGLALLAFAGLVGGAAWGVGELAGGTGWIATLAATVGGVVAVFLAIWLFVPVGLAIAGLFLDSVAEAVERRHYPGLPPPQGASLAAQARFNLVLALKVLGLNLLILPIALVLPMVGTVALWGIAAIFLGHGLFEGVAQRRMSVPEARSLRRRREGSVLALGAVLALAALVPGLNLLVPVVGTAAAVHLLHRSGTVMLSESRG